jgi:predicted AlkP superfamily pyrophosphatase or phosphodiesterase
MKKKCACSLTILFALVALTLRAQSPAKNGSPARPALVVGLVVDQMRYDYLYRYTKNYTEKGFRRLLREGYTCENAHYDYVPTYTAPGHACIYTGSVPSVNGIISNDWYDRESKQSIYCVNDTTVSAVGTTSISGKMSPRRLLSTTVTDELRFATNYRSKVVAVALKDRGSVLPGGFTANAAYWHDPYKNNWVTSTYYMEDLPEWAKRFNDRRLTDTLTAQPWNLLLAPEQYTGSTADDTPYEGPFKTETRPVFPHDLPVIRKEDSELIRKTPFGNTYTLEFAKAAVDGERLGKNGETDFLAVSLSSPDYVGHQFGVNAMETEDTYVRLDRELAEFIDFLDNRIGRNNYLLFLTADHGACPNPEFNADHRIPSAVMEEKPMRDSIRMLLLKQFGDSSMMISAGSTGIYLDREKIQKNKLDAAKVEEACAKYVLRFKGVSNAWTATELSRSLTREGIARLVQRGFHVQRSADVCIQLQPGWIDWYRKQGTSHGSSYAYDTHVPVVFFGGGVRAGETHLPVSVCDIAPTVAAWLSIQEPSGCVGKPIEPLLRR